MDLSKLTCNVCGENNFTLQEGFFYCDECGTQTQLARDFEVEDDFNEGPQKFQKSHRLQNLKDQSINYQNELTSWECFNYLLSGLAEELVQLGAKRELKTVTLQLWAVYLRKMEAAFFDKKHPSLPKLGPLFSKRDAGIIYNRNLTKEKKRKRKKSNITNERRRLKKQKMDFIEKEYLESSEYNTSLSYNSTSSAATSRAIRLEFSKIARKIFKKIMPKEHLAKHAEDYDNVLECHDLTSKRGHLVPRKIKGLNLSRKTVYTILYLALNLTEDQIQLADMLRFMRDGFLSTNKISHFFPDNVADNCVKLVLSHQNCTKNFFIHSAIRAHAALLAKLLYVPELKLPNILALVQRYLIELHLPAGIAICVERLLNFCPPQMKFRFTCQATPCYEGRAMAYIIFVMKLLFGLDDIKEKEISLSAKKINKKLEKLSESKVFVWEQWRNYIEMRKVILAQCHCPTSIALNEQTDMSQLIDHVQNEIPPNEEYGKAPNVFERLQKLFENFDLQPLKEEARKIEFVCSMTPNNAYFELILQNTPSNVYIPDYMYEDYSVLDVDYLIKPSRLRQILMEHNIKLEIQRLECNPNRNFLGIFANYSDKERRQDFGRRYKKANFNIEEEEWLENIPKYEEFHVFPTAGKGTASQNAKSDKEVKFGEIENKTKERDAIKTAGKPEAANTTKKVKKKSVSLLLREKILELLAEREKENQLGSFKNIPNTSANSPEKNKAQVERSKQRTVSSEKEGSITSTNTAEDKQVTSKKTSVNIPKNEKCISPMPMAQNAKSSKQAAPTVSSQTPAKTLVDSEWASLKSFDIFSETDMNPLNDLLNEPRKISEEINLFRDVSDDDIDDQQSDNENFSQKIQLTISALDYWTLMGEVPNLPNIQYEVVRNHMPTNFLWLLDTCSHIISIDSHDLLQELLTIESYLIYSLDAVKDVKNLVFSKELDGDRNLTRCTGIYKQLW